MPLIEISVERKAGAISLDTSIINRRVADYMVSSTQRKINGGIKPANAPLTTAVKQNSKTLRDRGQLLASITSRSDESSGVVGTNHIGAKLNHFGGTIRAKKKWLWIPASSWTRAQQRRYGFSPGEVMSGLRKDGYGVWIQSKTGASGVVFAKKKGKRSKLRLVFILKKSVTIPARPFLFVDDLDRQVIRSIVNSSVVGDGKQ